MNMDNPNIRHESASTRYGQWTVKMLQSELKRRAARCTGTREQLIQRLQDYDRNDNFKVVISDTEAGTLYSLVWPPSDSFKSVTNNTAVPDLDVIHISAYFLEVYKDNAGLTEYAAVHRKAYNMLVSNFLCAMMEAAISPHFFYRGQVNSEYTKALTYHVQIAISVNGQIIQSECECTAGKGPKAVCKHVGVVCYAILKFKENCLWHIRKTCTQKKQQWHVPKKSRLDISPKKSHQLNLEVCEFNRVKKMKGGLCFDPRSPDCIKNENFCNRVQMHTINFCKLTSKHLGFSGILPTAVTSALIHDHDYFDVPLHHKYVLNMISLTPEKSAEIEIKTRGQSKCQLWHFERSIRVSGSVVGEICRFTERRNKEEFAKNLVSPRPLNTSAVLWGKTKEATAIECYEALTTNTVKRCGFCVLPEHPYIGATPDGLVASVTVLEVKCPYSIRDRTISCDNYSHIEFVEDKLSLKKTSPYYFQVQTQMLVTNRKYCDLFLWTNVDEKLLSVDRDDELITM